MAGSPNISAEDQELIRKIGRMKRFFADIRTEVPLQDLYRKITTNVTELFDADGSAFYTYDNDKDELKLVCVNNLRDEIVGINVSADQGLLREVVSNRKVMKIDDYKNWPGRSEIFEQDQYSAIMEAPLIYDNNLIGIVGLVRIGESKAFNDVDVSFLGLLSLMIAIVLDLKC